MKLILEDVYQNLLSSVTSRTFYFYIHGKMIF